VRTNRYKTRLYLRHYVTGHTATTSTG